MRAAERAFRESIRILTPLEDRAALCESQRGLAQLLVAQGRLDEAERYALAARETVGQHDNVSRGDDADGARHRLRRAGPRRRGGGAAARRGRDHRRRPTSSASSSSRSTALAGFLRERGRGDEAAQFEERLGALSVAESTARIA